jgi:site-specific DNA-methyltransferase (adenine-specific)
MKIQTLPLDDIKPYWRNPRKNEGAVEAVKQSITDYGFNQPIILDVKKVIIAGHTRYKALMELGWKEAPCVVIDLPPAKAKEYRIADNKTSELSEWDMDALIPELREIDKVASMQVFFPDLDLKGLLEDTATVASVTTAQVEKAEASLNGQFEEKSATVQGQYVEILCPHCAEAFFLDRAELNRQPSQDKAE